LENVTLVTAFGKKSNRIKKQAMIVYAIGSDLFENNFFISPQLINDAILGCQFFKEYGITLDFKRGSFTYFKGSRTIVYSACRMSVNRGLRPGFSKQHCP
jgi:hypothetical protein